jgi:hypothetical protein
MYLKDYIRRGDNVEQQQNYIKRGDNVDQKNYNVDKKNYIRRGDNVDQKKLYKEGRSFHQMFCISHIVCSLFL